MTTMFKKNPAGLILLLALVLVSGCAGDVVNLHYVAEGPVLQSSGKQVVLLELEDKRPQAWVVGRRENGDMFTGNVRASEWISRALADEFIRQGVQVYYAGAGAGSSGVPVISGSVDNFWLSEVGNTSYDVDMKITLHLNSAGGKAIYTESFWCKQRAQFLPSESNISDLMSDTLRDLAAPAAQAMRGRI